MTTTPTLPVSTVEQLLERARSAIGRGTVYRLGGGGMRPLAPLPYDAVSRECDCSGFVCWALGVKRHTSHPLYLRFNAGWINTDAIVHDATRETGFFRRLAVPVVGALVVYGARKGVRQVGHVGIVSEVAGGEIARVIHCSAGNYRRHGDAIRETGPEVFRAPDAICAWYEGIEVAGEMCAGVVP